MVDKYDYGVGDIDDDDNNLLDNNIERAPIWIISLGDIVALMLAFFVMIFSMSTIQTEKYEKIVSLISTNIKSNNSVIPISQFNIPTVDLIGGLPPEYLNKILTDKLSRDKVLSKAYIAEISNHVIISLPTDIIFKPGSAEVEKKAMESISRLAGVMSQFGNKVNIAGHTDPEPIVNNKDTTNWDLSLSRSLKIAILLKKYGYVGDFTVLGHADSRYRFLDKRFSEEERYELSRRVDLIILPIAGGQP